MIYNMFRKIFIKIGETMKKKKLQLIITAEIFVFYFGLILLSNVLRKIYFTACKEIYLSINRLIFVIFVIPLFSIILPIVLVKKWKHNFNSKEWSSENI